jgi:hypothetical protein
MTHVIPLSSRVNPAPGVVAREMPDGAVLVHLGSNRIFELNVTGSRIWTLIESGRTGEEIVRDLTAEFDVDADAASREVAALTARLAEAGLVTP